MRETQLKDSGLRYYSEKIKRAARDGTLTGKLWRRAAAELFVPAIVLRRYARLAAADKALDVAAGFADHRSDPRTVHVSVETARRIQSAYLKAKTDELSAPPAFQVRGLWAEWRDINHRALMAALRGPAEDLAAFLDNLEREQSANGTGAGYQEFLHRGRLLPRAYIQTAWCDYRDKAAAHGVNIQDVVNPLVGNPAGLWHGDSVIQVENWRHAFKAREMLGILADTPAPVILEIGGGFGSQCFQVMRLGKGHVGRYFDFDIPEVAAVASAFLITALPDRKVCLYGEAPVSSAGDYDIGIFPHFTIEAIEPESVDLVFNSNSFSEMDGASATRYLEIVERVSRGWFRHTNHERRMTFKLPDGTQSRNRISSEMVPDPTQWDLVFKRRRIFSKPEDLTYRSYEYLYRRRRGVASNSPQLTATR